MATKGNDFKTGNNKLSIDTWAVILALSLAALVRFGLLKHVGW